MNVDCEGCAGCCLDWRPLTDADIDHEQRGNRRPLDGTANLVPLTRDEVRAFIDAGHGDALIPRLFTDDDGVLILSDQAGAHEELGEHALTINPYDTESFADAIVRALTMDPGERRNRMAALREQVESHDLYAWMDEVFATARDLREQRDHDGG